MRILPATPIVLPLCKKAANAVGAALLFTIVLNGSTSLFAQGSLTPPGAPAPTMKSLAQIEPRTPISSAPFTITTPGAYYVTTNLSLSGSSEAIFITTGNVTIDLGGFSITGWPGASGIVGANAGLKNISVRNGILSGWANGIDVSAVTGGSLEGILSTSNATYGLAAGNDWTIANCVLSSNGIGGLHTQGNCVIRNIVTESNKGNGITLTDNCIVSGCTARFNTNNGISTGINTVLRDCTIRQNGGAGIMTGDSAAISGCVSKENAGDNIQTGFHCVVTQCSTEGSTGGNGINLAGGFGVISDCTANNNNQYGIVAFQRSRVTGCVASGNSQSGIHATFVGTVQSCLCDGNAFCGILADAGGVVDILDNTCAENGITGTNHGAGIRVLTPGACRILRNNVGFGYIGVDANSTRNLIFANSATSNTTNYNIISGNSFGPIVNVSSVGDISGTANANHPQANFQY